MFFITEKAVLAHGLEICHSCLADTGPSIDLTRSATGRAKAHREQR